MNNRRAEGYWLDTLGEAYTAMEDYEQAITSLRQSADIAAEIGDVRLQSFAGGSLARAYLHTGQLAAAIDAINVARQHNNPQNNDYAAVVNGLILMRLGQQQEAQVALQEALTFAAELLAKTPNYYAAKYRRGLALSALALLATNEEQTQLLNQARVAYADALANCDARGVIKRNLHLFKELQHMDAAGLSKVIEALLSDA
jgi:tetratricopeptide (TPR) repeat protein